MKQEYEKVLEYLRSRNEDATPIDIARTVQMDSATVLNALRLLQEEGYVKTRTTTEPLGTNPPKPLSFYAVSEAELRKICQREQRRKEREEAAMRR